MSLTLIPLLLLRVSLISYFLLNIHINKNINILFKIDIHINLHIENIFVYIISDDIFRFSISINIDKF